MSEATRRTLRSRGKGNDIPVGGERLAPGNKVAHNHDDIANSHVDCDSHDCAMILGQSFAV